MEASPQYNPVHQGKSASIKEFQDNPAQKGKYMVLKGHGFARWKGMPETSTVHALDITKDTFSTFLSEVKGKTLKRIIMVLGIFYILFRRAFKKVGGEVIRIAINSLYEPILKYKMNPMKYTRSVREIYRLFSVMIDREQQDGMKDKWRKLRDIVCLILEYDNSYRFRLQDILKEMKMEEMAFDEEDMYYMEKRDPREYRYESYVDYSQYDTLKKKAFEQIPEPLRGAADDAMIKWVDWNNQFGGDCERKYNIMDKDLQKYGYKSWEDFFHKMHDIKVYPKVEILKLEFYEKVMQLKERYQQELDRMQKVFNEDKDNLVLDMSALMNRFWERTNLQRTSYQETQKLLAEDVAETERLAKEAEEKANKTEATEAVEVK